MTNVLGLLYNNNDEEQIPAEITELIEKRKEARKAKDFALADSIRDQIKALGWVVEETRQAPSSRKHDLRILMKKRIIAALAALSCWEALSLSQGARSQARTTTQCRTTIFQAFSLFSLRLRRKATL
ncbi:MAG: hypothetical protein ACLSG5_13245 [Oscillospiraceae bacterium]